jgi:hypothetical protein
MIRRACGLLGVIALLLQGSEGGHMLLVEHTRCAEHGELVHAADGHEHASADEAAAEHSAFQAAAELGDEAGHGHCSHASERRDAAADVPTSHALALRRVASISSLREASAFPTLARLYRTAPKNSPPA